MEKRSLNYKIRPATKADKKEILNLSNGGYISFIYCVVTEILFYIVWFYLVVTLSIQPVIFHVRNNSLAIDVILLSGGVPGESFLPFGINRIFPVGLKSILILALFFLFFILFLISGIYFYKISSVILIIMFLAVLFVLPKFTNLIIRRHLSQLWIVKYGDSSIGYGRLSYNSEYSILHSINCLGKTYDLKDTSSTLIKHLFNWQTNQFI